MTSSICFAQRSILDKCFSEGGGGGGCSNCPDDAADWLFPSLVYDNCSSPGFGFCSSLVVAWDSCLCDRCQNERIQFCACVKAYYDSGYFACEDYLLTCFDGCALSFQPIIDSPTAAPMSGPTGPQTCPEKRALLDSCLSNNNAGDSACGSCLAGAESQLVPRATDTCASVSARTCAYLNNPICPCPIKACGDAIEEYFGCYKEEINAGGLGCDNSMVCFGSEAGESPSCGGILFPFCLLANFISRSFAAILAILGFGGN